MPAALATLAMPCTHGTPCPLALLPSQIQHLAVPSNYRKDRPIDTRPLLESSGPTILVRLKGPPAFRSPVLCSARPRAARSQSSKCDCRPRHGRSNLPPIEELPRLQPSTPVVPPKAVNLELALQVPDNCGTFRAVLHVRPECRRHSHAPGSFACLGLCFHGPPSRSWAPKQWLVVSTRNRQIELSECPVLVKQAADQTSEPVSGLPSVRRVLEP